MAESLRKQPPRKGYGSMAQGSSQFLDATMAMNIDRMKACIKADPNCVHDTDANGNNAMHLCVIGGAAIRVPEVMTFLIEETEINLLHENSRQLNPLELALAQNDQLAVELLDEPTNIQLDRRYPIDEAQPALTVINGTGGKPSEPSP